MSFPASSPNLPHPLPPQPPTEAHPRTLREDHSYVSSTMNSHPYPSRFDFNTASVAIAQERAGTWSRPAPRGQRPVQFEDRQDPYEAILLGPGENKIDVEVDTRLPSAAIFTFHKEDHTLGNMIRTRLLRTPHVTFAAYRVPHPLTPNFVLRCQTDGEITPRQAVINACQALIKDLGILSREFTKEYELRKMANAANQQQNIGE